MNLFVDDKKVDISGLIKKQLTSVYPGFYQDRPVEIMVLAPASTSDAVTGVQKFNTQVCLMPYNRVPFTTKDGVVEDGEMKELRLADSQKLDKKTGAYRYAINGPMRGFIVIQGRFECNAPGDALMLWFLTFVSGMVKGNLCPQEYQGQTQTVYIHSSLIAAKAVINDKSVSIAKAKLYLMDSVDGLKDIKQLKELSKLLNVEHVGSKDEFELRHECVVALEADLSGSVADIVHTFRDGREDKFQAALYVKEKVDAGKLVYDEGTSSWKLKKGDQLGATVHVVLEGDEPMASITARLQKDYQFRIQMENLLK